MRDAPPPLPNPTPHTNTQTQALVYDILPSATAVFSYAIGSRKLSDNELFFVGDQTVVNLLQTTQIISDVYFITMLLTEIFLAQIKPKSFDSILFFLLFSFFFTQGGCASCLRVCLGARLLPQSYQYPNCKHLFTTSFLQPLPYLDTP